MGENPGGILREHVKESTDHRYEPSQGSSTFGTLYFLYWACCNIEVYFLVFIEKTLLYVFSFHIVFTLVPFISINVVFFIFFYNCGCSSQLTRTSTNLSRGLKVNDQINL